MKKMNFNYFLILISLLYQCNFLLAQMPDKIEPFPSPFGDFNFEKPVFPDKSVNIVDFGAKEGGGFMNTEAINNAIKKISTSGGGKIIVSKGIWLTGPINLQSNVNLHLEEGAELLFSQNFDDYLPAVLTNWEGSELYSYSPFIYAVNQENIAITGKGVLNGQGKPWWLQRRKGEWFRQSNQKLKEMNWNEVPVEDRQFGTLETFLPPVFFGPRYCKNILLEGVTFKYGAFWTINPCFCENVIVRGIYVLTYGEYGHTPNGDGINPNACQNVLIEYNTLDTGDDCITLKSGRDNDGRNIGLPCKNILIRHNYGLQGHGGIVIGSEMSGGVENVYAHDCKFNGTDRVIRIKTQRGRGGYVKNCWFKDISADTIQREAIRINMLYHGDRLPAGEVNSGTPVIENINYENIQCNYTKRNVIQIIGIPEMPVKNITLKNINLGGNQGIEIIDAENVTLNNLSISNHTGPFSNISYSNNINIEQIEIIDSEDKVIPFEFNEVTNSSLKKVKTKTPGTLVKINDEKSNVEFDKTVPENKVERMINKD